MPHLIAAGGGAIVNVLNVGAKAPGGASLPTTASRAAGLAITKAASKDLGGHGIRVNAVLIGLVESGQGRRRAHAAGLPRTSSTARGPAGPSIPLGQGGPVGRVRRPGGLPPVGSLVLRDRLGHQSRRRKQPRPLSPRQQRGLPVSLRGALRNPAWPSGTSPFRRRVLPAALHVLEGGLVRESPPATVSRRCRSCALMTSSAVVPWMAKSHGPPSCWHVIVFMGLVPLVNDHCRPASMTAERATCFSIPACFSPRGGAGGRFPQSLTLAGMPGVGLVHELWNRVTGTQPVPPAWAIAVSGVAALLIVLDARAWRLARNSITIAHEGGHALVSVLSGRRLDGIRLHSDTSGVTYSRGKRTGTAVVLTSAAGYLTPSLLGAGAAWLLAAHHVTAMLWLLLALLAATFLAIRNAYGVLAVLVTRRRGPGGKPVRYRRDSGGVRLRHRVVPASWRGSRGRRAAAAPSPQPPPRRGEHVRCRPARPADRSARRRLGSSFRAGVRRRASTRNAPAYPRPAASAARVTSRKISILNWQQAAERRTS